MSRGTAGTSARATADCLSLRRATSDGEKAVLGIDA
jgi:hypothetical protein